MNLPTILLRRVGPTRSAGSQSASLRLPPLLQQYCRALREATRSRNRLTRLAPDIFSAPAFRQSQDIDDDQVAIQEVRDAYAKIAREEKGLPAIELPPEAASISVPSSSSGTELDCPSFHRLSDAKKNAIQFEFTAYQAWKQVADSARAQIETEENAWARLEPAHAAQVMHWRSLFEQAHLGVPVLSRKTGLLFEESAKAKPTTGCFRKEIIEKFCKAYPNEPAPSTMEELVRAQVRVVKKLGLWQSKSSGQPDKPTPEPKAAAEGEEQPRRSSPEIPGQSTTPSAQTNQPMVTPEEKTPHQSNASPSADMQKAPEKTTQTPDHPPSSRRKKTSGGYVSFKA